MTDSISRDDPSQTVWGRYLDVISRPYEVLRAGPARDSTRVFSGDDEQIESGSSHRQRRFPVDGSCPVPDRSVRTPPRGRNPV